MLSEIQVAMLAGELGAEHRAHEASFSARCRKCIHMEHTISADPRATPQRRLLAAQRLAGVAHDVVMAALADVGVCIGDMGMVILLHGEPNPVPDSPAGRVHSGTGSASVLAVESGRHEMVGRNTIGNNGENSGHIFSAVPLCGQEGARSK